MNRDIFLPSLAAICLLIYALKKWALKGEFLNPCFIYSMINTGIFIIFTFGPYIYTYSIQPYYYYLYVIVLYCFVAGFIGGCAKGRKKLVKDIKFTSTQLFIFYLVAVIIIIFGIVPLILASGGSLEGAVSNRFESMGSGLNTTRSNPIVFVLRSLQFSFIQISTALITSYALWKRRHYKRIIVLFILMTLNALFLNSRTTFVFGLVLILIPIYTSLKDRGLIDLTKIKWSKNFKYTVPAITITVLMIFILTNLRSSVTTESNNLNFPFESIEYLLGVERKVWFDRLANALPITIINPIAELSLYAGGTVACGGAVSQIVLDSSLYTWGGRSFLPIHRIVDRLGIASGIIQLAQQNYQEILGRGRPEFYFYWWGFPANLFVDFGMIGAPLVSTIIGWSIGWIYSRICNSGLVLKSTGTALILNCMILTPAVSPFGYFPNFINLFCIGFYVFRKSYKKYVKKFLVE